MSTANRRPFRVLGRPLQARMTYVLLLRFPTESRSRKRPMRLFAYAAGTPPPPPPKVHSCLPSFSPAKQKFARSIRRRKSFFRTLPNRWPRYKVQRCLGETRGLTKIGPPTLKREIHCLALLSDVKSHGPGCQEPVSFEDDSHSLSRGCTC